MPICTKCDSVGYCTQEERHICKRCSYYNLSMYAYPCSVCKPGTDPCKFEDRYRGIDWERIPVDTKVLVKSGAMRRWAKRYFAKFELGRVYTFYGGGTSFTMRITESWDEVKLYQGDDKI